MDREAKLEEADGRACEVPIHIQLANMEKQIEAVKGLLQRTKDIKQEIKVEILTADEKIDENLERIGGYVASVENYYGQSGKHLTSQMESLAISKTDQTAEFEKKTFDGPKASEVYMQVQVMMDRKVAAQKTQ